jgi:formylglycine-generating enzyme
MRMLSTVCLLLFCILYCCPGSADSFGTGPNSFDIKFVSIGNPGNSGDPTGSPSMVGAVNYPYRIATYEISQDAIDKANAASTANGTPLNITTNELESPEPNDPATYISWDEAARFVNWLNTSCGYPPAYRGLASWVGTEGFDPSNPYRNSLAKYFLPTEDEWYKAAYYDPSTQIYYDHATGSDIAPLSVSVGTDPSTAIYDFDWTADSLFGYADVTQAGGLSPYGTMGQGGNVWEYMETGEERTDGLYRFSRGGGYLSSAAQISSSSNVSVFYTVSIVGGFRVASIPIPEPTSVALAALGCAAIAHRRRVSHLEKQSDASRRTGILVSA